MKLCAKFVIKCMIGNDEEIPKVDVEDIEKNIKEGQTLDDYSNLESKIENVVSKIEKETDEEKN